MTSQLCPGCGHPLDLTDPALDIGHCLRCDQVVRPSSAVAPYQGSHGRILMRAYTISVVPDPPHLVEARHTLAIPGPPPGLLQQVTNGTILLELPWRWNTDTGLLLLVGWFVVMPFLGGSHPIGSVLPAFCALLYLAHVFLNRTTVRITLDAVEIVHGPWPSLQTSQTLALDTLDGLQVQVWRSAGRRLSSVLYELRTSKQTLLAHWTDPVLLSHVKACIEIQRARSRT